MNFYIYLYVKAVLISYIMSFYKIPLQIYERIRVKKQVTSVVL